MDPYWIRVSLMALKKKWHIILARTDEPNLLNASLSKTTGLLVLSAVILFTLAVIFSFGFIVRWRIHFPQIETLQTENRVLREEIDKLVTEIDSIMFRLQQMEEWEDQLRLDRNFGRKMGTGGLPQIEIDYSHIGHEFNLNVNHIWHKVSELKNVSTFAYEMRKELVDNVSLQAEMYHYTPSIYPSYGRISSSYGWRTHPVTGRRDFHSGIDIANRVNSAVYATADGRVKEIGYNRYYGRYLIITHKFGYETMFAHLHSIQVKKGDSVSRGEIVARMGSSGRSTGSHLHYEVRRYGRHQNPYHYLNKMEEDIIITQN